MFKNRVNRSNERILSLRRQLNGDGATLVGAERALRLRRAKALAALRYQKVQSIRQAIAAGRYDLDSRLEDLLDRLPQLLLSPTVDIR